MIKCFACLVINSISSSLNILRIKSVSNSQQDRIYILKVVLPVKFSSHPDRAKIMSERIQWCSIESFLIKHRILIKGWPVECTAPKQVPGPDYEKRSLKVNDFRTIFRPILYWEKRGGFTEEKWKNEVDEARKKKEALKDAEDSEGTTDNSAKDCEPPIEPLRILPWTEGSFPLL